MTVITRTVLLLSLVSLFTDMASDMLYPVMPAYLRSIGFSVAIIGLLEGVAEAAAGLSKGYFGHLSDMSGKRLPFVRMGYAFSALSKPLMAAMVHPLWVFLVRTMDRLGKGMRTGARDAMLADEAHHSKRGTVFGFHRSMDTVGAAMGPAIALIWLYFRPGDYVPLFFIAFVPGLISIVMLFMMQERKPAQPKEKRVLTLAGGVTWIRKSPREYRRLLPVLLLFALVNSSDIFLLLRARSTGITDAGTVGLYIFYNLVFALCAYPLGRLSDRWGMKRIFIFGLLVFAGVYGGMSAGPGLQGMLLLFALYGIYAAATEGLAKAWISKVCHPGEKAAAIGTYTGLQSICALLASIWAGLLWDFSGPVLVFAITAGMTLLLALVMAWRIPEAAGLPPETL